jgi:SAM-dependent methyltransferase
MNPSGPGGEDVTTTEATNHWRRVHKNWNRLTSPWRPPAEAVAAFRRALQPTPGRTLLLGVTPELAFEDRDLVALDNSPEMIANVWPGDTARRKAVEGSWSEAILEAGGFQAALGDGALTCLPYPAGYNALFAEMARLLAPGGRLALRLFAAPRDCESIDDLVALAGRGQGGSFSAFRMRLAMALAAQNGGNIHTPLILETFETRFADRQRVLTLNGWTDDDIETIEIYRGSSAWYAYPTVAQVQAVVPAGFSVIEAASSGGYELADRCPILVLERR